MNHWPIYIISLADARSRREPLARILQHIGQKYEIFEAVDARRGVPNEYANLVDWSKAKAVLGREMSAPEAGCALSHLFLYRKVVDEGLPGAIIFEDDAILSEGDKFREFMDQRVYQRGNFIQLGYGAVRVWRCGAGQRRESHMLRSERLVYNAGLANAYSITAYAAEFILQRSIPVRCVADWPCDLRPIGPRIIVPRLVGCMPHGLNSYLEKPRLMRKKEGDGNDAIASRRKSWGRGVGERRNPPPPGYWYVQRYFSKTLF